MQEELFKQGQLPLGQDADNESIQDSELSPSKGVLKYIEKVPSHDEAKEKNAPMPHGKSVDATAKVVGKKFTRDKITGEGTYNLDGVLFGLKKGDRLSVGVSKLQCLAIAEFAKINHISNAVKEPKNLRVIYSLKEYATLCGYDVQAEKKSTPEEQAIENTKVKNSLDNVRKKVKNDLTSLMNLSISWDEKVKGKSTSFGIVRPFGAAFIKNGYITLDFGLAFAQYLVQCPITQYPLALLAIDERNSNAYQMGYKMTLRANMDNNIIKETDNLLKVSTLLKETDLPTISEVRAAGKTFHERIKEPFERCLDILVENGFLADWEYTHSKGVAMTDKEADPDTYEKWAGYLLKFTLKDKPDHTPRLANRAPKKRGRPKKKVEPS